MRNDARATAGRADQASRRQLRRLLHLRRNAGTIGSLAADFEALGEVALAEQTRTLLDLVTRRVDTIDAG
jgi:hypothetical protein